MNQRPPSPTADRDSELLAVRCQLGEAAAFDELVARWHGPLWRYVLAMCGDPALAEEILQDGWLRILRALPALRQPSRLRPWLFSILRRAFVDRLRARAGESHLEPLAEEPRAAREPELPWEDLELLTQALEELEPWDREATVLFYLRELELRDIAEVQGVPVGTVKSRLHRSRRLLRTFLEARGITSEELSS
ncbi:MAG: sigma-70 family RNA polymerase sigma factor [Acidobacteriota bacterium]